MRKTILFAVLCAVGGCNSGFSDDDINNVKNSIRNEYNKRAYVEVIDVQMIKESPKKLTGLVKVKITSPSVSSGFGGVGILLGRPEQREEMMSCSAIMGEGHQYLWTCKSFSESGG